METPLSPHAGVWPASDALLCLQGVPHHHPCTKHEPRGADHGGAHVSGRVACDRPSYRCWTSILYAVSSQGGSSPTTIHLSALFGATTPLVQRWSGAKGHATDPIDLSSTSQPANCSSCSTQAGRDRTRCVIHAARRGLIPSVSTLHLSRHLRCVSHGDVCPMTQLGGWHAKAPIPSHTLSPDTQRQ